MDLSAEFPVPSLDDWRAAAGADAGLVWEACEGVVAEPLYPRPAAKNLPRLGRPAARPWLIEQEVSCADPAKANAAILDGLAKGQTAVRLVGCRWAAVDDLRVALEGVDLAAQPISIEGANLLEPLAALARERGTPLSRLHGLVCAPSAEAAVWAQEHAPALRTVLIDGRPHHEAGASAVEQLAAVIADAADHMRTLINGGVEPNRAADAFGVSLAVSQNIPLEIAKLRAARSLWMQVARAFGGEQAVRPMSLHVSTGLRDLSVDDLESNLVRTAIQAFIAAVGGCDSLSVAPFDMPAGGPTPFSERLARNQQLLLLEEAHVGRVADPLGGSGAFEALTDAVARAAWARVQQIEEGKA